MLVLRPEIWVIGIDPHEAIKGQTLPIVTALYFSKYCVIRILVESMTAPKLTPPMRPKVTQNNWKDGSLCGSDAQIRSRM